MIASPVETVEAKQIWKYLEYKFKEGKPDELIIGMPKSLKGEDTDGTKVALDFSKKFKKRYPHIQVVEADERFTSVMALQAMNMAGMKLKGNKALVDELSACIILQGYLDSKNR